MNRNEETGSTATLTVAESPERECSGPDGNGKTPFVPRKEKSKASLGETGRLLFIGGGIALVLLLFAFSGISRRTSPAQRRSRTNSQTQNAKRPDDLNPSISLTPILDAGKSPEQKTDDSRVDSDQIARLATKRSSETMARSLGDVPPFENLQTWQPPPYQPGLQPAAILETQVGPSSGAQSGSNREAADKASLVFVGNNTSPTAMQKLQEPVTALDLVDDVAPGTRLRARLESAISTAVHTPVVAVIQYNYEHHGEIVIPAGAKAFGNLENVDHSGYVGIRFEALQMPDGSSVVLDATATDLQLRPLRGRVEGKHVGKSILVRSFAGVGEIAATLAGRGSLNQPLSEGDLLRERITNNIGQASDQSVARLELAEHVVVSVPAGTEIYVILQKPAKENVLHGLRSSSQVQTSNQPSIDELRQLLQLQRELNHSVIKQLE